ncbi:MAG TPA: hypothetical protein VGP36_20110 [Mycobacteriales bacterium]|nr:hypothetical protein [Mycobacteriales bacterium]
MAGEPVGGEVPQQHPPASVRVDVVGPLVHPGVGTSRPEHTAQRDARTIPFPAAARLDRTDRRAA